MLGDQWLTDRKKRYNQRLLELDGVINANSAMIPICIEQFKMASIKGLPHDAEKAREEVLRIQGEIMDTIYARASLMREAGLI